MNSFKNNSSVNQQTIKTNKSIINNNNLGGGFESINDEFNNIVPNNLHSAKLSDAHKNFEIHNEFAFPNNNINFNDTKAFGFPAKPQNVNNLNDFNNTNFDTFHKMDTKNADFKNADFDNWDDF